MSKAEKKERRRPGLEPRNLGEELKSRLSPEDKEQLGQQLNEVHALVLGELKSVEKAYEAGRLANQIRAERRWKKAPWRRRKSALDSPGCQLNSR